MIPHWLNMHFKSFFTPGLNQRSFSPTNVRWMNLRMWMCTYPTLTLLPRRKEWILASTQALRLTPQPTWTTWPRCPTTWAASTASTATAGNPSTPEAGHPSHSVPRSFLSKLPDTTAFTMSTGNLSLATCHDFPLILRISKTCCGTKLAAQTLLERTLCFYLRTV